MLFNSIDYFIFLPLVGLLYFILPFKYRWILLLGASYFFYMSWKAEYIVLIITSTIVDYYCGLQMGKIPEKKKRKPFLYLSIIVNLGILFTFKYYNFFNSSVSEVFSDLNINYNTPVSSLILPIGISFYTFQTMSYSIDVYNDKIKPEKHFGIFALFVTFFPQLVAGPIERAGHLLKQFKVSHPFKVANLTLGGQLIVWGLFKKVVIADRLAIFVDNVYDQPYDHSGISQLLATVFFAFQIYCDFSGYSDIAIGSARLLGFDLMQNFRQPYFSKSISEFWSRWHISLSTWFRDYLYIPLGGNRTVKWRWYYNLMITFLVSGLWHGANWTFVVWGFIHGFFILCEKLINYDKLGSEKFSKILKISLNFVIVLLAWVYFRANTITDANFIITNIITSQYSNIYTSIADVGMSKPDIIASILLIIFLLAIDFFQKSQTKYVFYGWPRIVKWAIIYLMIFSIIFIGIDGENQFIYFQF